MKKILSISLLSLFLISCVSLDKIRTENRTNLNRISLGMSKSEVLNIMGTETVRDFDSRKRINNPFRTEILSEGDKKYEVVFYYTDKKRNVSSVTGSITDDELTPIVFFNGKVEGYGWLYVKDNFKRYQINMR